MLFKKKKKKSVPPAISAPEVVRFLLAQKYNASIAGDYEEEDRYDDIINSLFFWIKRTADAKAGKK